MWVCLMATQKATMMYAVLLIIGLIIGVAIGYAIKPAPPAAAPTTVTQTVTSTSVITKTVTAAAGPQEIVIRAMTVGPDEPSYNRFENLKRAAELLNKMLADAGIPVTVKIEGEFWTGSWEDYKNKLLMMFQAGEAPDIILSGHEDIAPWAEAGYILPLDDFIAKYEGLWFFDDIIPSLWDSVKYKGKIWGIPQDTEARPLYFRKDLLKDMGWTDEDIEEFKKKAWNGEITLWDLLEICKEAIDKGVIEEGYCIWHRPKRGVDYYQIYLAFGGILQDPETGKLVLDKKAMLNMMKWLHDAVHKYKALRSDMIGLDWKIIHENWVAGKLLFWFGGTWQKAEWVKKYNMPEEEFWANIDFIPVPPGEKGGKPVTLSHPLVYMISSQSKHPDLAFLIVALATNPLYNAIHAVESGHLAIMYSELSAKKYQEDKWLAVSASLLEFSKFPPNHAKFGTYDEIVFKAMGGVESGELSPEDAVSYIVDQLKAQLGDEIVIKE